MEVLSSQPRIWSKRFLINNSAQSDILQRTHTQQRRVTRVVNRRDSRSHRFARAPCCRNKYVIGCHSFESRNGEFPEPRKEVAFLVFEIAAHCCEFQMSVSVDESRKDDGLAERFFLESRKPLSDLSLTTNAGNKIV